MSGMNDKEVAEYAERLKSLCSIYQMYKKREKELIRDVERRIISPHGSPLKLVVGRGQGDVEIELEKSVHKAITSVICEALDSDRSISYRVKDGIVENIDEIHVPDIESRDHINRVCKEMIEIYCRNITYEKERRENEARIKNQRLELAKRTIAGVFRSAYV